MQNENLAELNLKTLLSEDVQYEIPVYQRNYAWEAKEIEQLIQDVIDYAVHRPNQNYYIGTLVVSADTYNPQKFSTIDGQQRLTTIAILTSVVKRHYDQERKMEWFSKLNLSYASREKSTLSMTAAFNRGFKGIEHSEKYENNIRAAYDICTKVLKNKTNESKLSLTDFVKYLYNRVKIVRVTLPSGIDLNHYFEIMNSRGEQLEKHEVLKAKLLECFKELDKIGDKSSKCFNLIWEACSNMEKYVQYGFTPEQRHLIFGENNWNTMAVYDFDGLVDKINWTIISNSNSIELSIDELISGKAIAHDLLGSEEKADRFSTVIDFQNFLLHVLQVQTAKNDIALDDKRLLDIFAKELPAKSEDRIVFVKQFGFNLLKCKFLYDKYVIKREYTANTDRWSLKSLRWYNPSRGKNAVKYTNTFGEENNENYHSDNRRVLMLLAMFHVSMPSMSYKYWLNASLNYLFHQFEIISEDYILYLEHIAKSFVFDRYLAKENPSEYYDMIYAHEKCNERSMDRVDTNKLNFGVIRNNLVFNFVDYLLWLNMKMDEENRVKTFEFTFRSSIEHYYPQTPIHKNVDSIEATHLHCFGNLCLISHEKNSRLNNLPPGEKKKYYLNKEVPIDSLKQFLMMTYANWTVNEIQSHNTAMEDLLRQNMNSDYKPKHDIPIANRWFKEYQVKDKVLLCRALLCFGDYAKHVSGDRHNLFDFDHIREQEAFKAFQKYIELNSPNNLTEIIDERLKDENLRADYRFLFIKYPKAIEYCKEGNFQWFEQTEGRLIYLLEAATRTTHKAKELYLFILKNILEEEWNVSIYSERDCLYIKIGYNEGNYYFAESHENTPLELWVWNNDGNSIDHCVISKVNGNSNAVKSLSDFNWVKNGEGDYERLGKTKLIKLGDNCEENILKLHDATGKMLRNGFGLDLKKLNAMANV